MDNPSLATSVPSADSAAAPLRWSPATRIDARIALTCILAVAASLRFGFLGRNSIWTDEAYMAWMTRFGWHDMIAALRASDAHPPLYFLLIKAWSGIAGIGEAALRFPAACFSLLSVWLTYALMRRVAPEPVALLGGLLVTLSPLQVMIGQDGRMYALLGALALGSTLALVLAVEHGGPRRWAAYTAVAGLIVYTHYLGALVLAAHGLWVAIYERRHLIAWLGSMAVAALLFLPWLPAFWDQLRHGNGWPWYRHSQLYVDLADLFGLFAFGGSLFGMGSYFFPGTAPLATQAIVLLPFLLVVWQGVWSCLSKARAVNCRGVALLGLTAALPIGVLVALALGRLIFYPRWLAFLGPFFSMFLALGVGALADRMPSGRRYAAALLSTALLLSAVPVLGRYYFDSTFRAYRWREAAVLVKAQAGPRDLFLYVNESAMISFSYYYREPHSSVTLTPVEARAGTAAQRPGFTATQARQLAARYPRVWLIATVPLTAEMQQRLLSALETAYHVVGRRDFTAVWVHLLEAKPVSVR